MFHTQIYLDEKAAPIVLSIAGLKSLKIKRVTKLDFPAAVSPNNTTYEYYIEITTGYTLIPITELSSAIV